MAGPRDPVTVTDARRAKDGTVKPRRIDAERMETRTKALLVALPVAVLGFMLGSNAPLGALIWPPAPGGHAPTGLQLPLLMIVAVIEALAFGAGAAFLVFGLPLVKRAPVSNRVAWAAYLAAGWGLVSWVPHTAMHISNPADAIGRLVAIEYIFHVTLVLSAAALATFFVKVAQASASVRVAAQPPRPVQPLAR